MRDFPVFTTENGVGSLIFREIPYLGAAYVKIQSSQSPQTFVEECLDFCRVVGAEKVYATGHPWLERYPLHTAMWKMRISRDALPETDACLFPVQEHTLNEFRQLCNRRMKDIPNASWMTEADGKKMLEDGSGYFVHRNGALLGIGMVSGSVLQTVVSAVPGGGRDVVCALAHAVAEGQITLTVASENVRAVRLYETLGFIRTEELSRWYRIFPENIL